MGEQNLMVFFFSSYHLKVKTFLSLMIKVKKGTKYLSTPDLD